MINKSHIKNWVLADIRNFMHYCVSAKEPAVISIITYNNKKYKFVNSRPNFMWWPDIENIIKSINNNFDNIESITFRYSQVQKIFIYDYILNAKQKYIDKFLMPLLIFQAGNGIDKNIRNIVNQCMETQFLQELIEV